MATTSPEPIIMLRSKDPDGRYKKVAVEAGVTPTFREFIGADPLAFVRKKILRQHLDTSQRAMFAAKLANLKRGRPSNPDLNPPKDGIEPVSTATAASMLNVSEKAVERAKAVVQHGTEALQHAVEDGTVTVTDAARVAKETPEIQNAAVEACRPELIASRDSLEDWR